jgi:hypothetical protein
VNIREQLNTYKSRKDGNKALPSGVTPKEIYFMPEDYGMEQCLRYIDPQVIQDAKMDIGGPSLLEFVPAEYAACAEEVIEHFGGIKSLSYEMIWDTFVLMLPHMPPAV